MSALELVLAILVCLFSMACFVAYWFLSKIQMENWQLEHKLKWKLIELALLTSRGRR